MEPQTSASNAANDNVNGDSSAASIEALIASDASPVGIDAKKTHVIIIQKLMDIQARLERLERLERKIGSDEGA